MKESSYNIWVERGASAYVFNGVSGALLRVPHEQRRALQGFLAGDEDSACPPKLLVMLASGRMLVQDGSDELDLLGKRYEASRGDTSYCSRKTPGRRSRNLPGRSCARPPPRPLLRPGAKKRP